MLQPQLFEGHQQAGGDDLCGSIIFFGSDSPLIQFMDTWQQDFIVHECVCNLWSHKVPFWIVSL